MPTSIEHSTFTNLKDTFPHRATSVWPDDFLEWTDINSSAEREKIPLWSPALYRDGAVRRKGETTQGIETVTALVLDYDWKPEADRSVTIEQARSVWSAFEYVLHTTASHRIDAHRFRIVLPYSRPVTATEHTWLWERWALKYTSGRGALPDPISEPSRMFFIPTRRVDFEQGAISEHHAGEALNVDEIFSTPEVGVPPASATPTPNSDFVQPQNVAEKASADIIAAFLKKMEGRPRLKQPMFAGIQNCHELEDLGLIESKCAFMRHARDNAAKLPEPEWFAWLSIIGRCKDGRKSAHEIGAAHGGYSYDETEEKLKRAVVDAGPRGCENIRKLSNACKDCPLGKPVGDVTSPVQLGRPEKPEPSQDDSSSGTGGETVEDAAATCARLERALERLRAEHAEAQLEEARAKVKLKYRQGLAKISTSESDPASDEAAKELIASKQRVKRLADKIQEADKILKATKKKTQILNNLISGSDTATVGKLLMTEKGPKSVLANVLAIIETDPAYVGKIKYNLFAEDIQLVHEGSTRSATDHLDTEINADIQRRYLVDVGTNILREAMLSVARKHEFNPVADYLRGLVWDGVSRLEHLMRRGFGAAGNITGKVAVTGVSADGAETVDIKYLSEAGTKLCIGAVARVLSPAGCKVDTVVVLYGAQGRKKSTGLKALAGASWFDDSLMRDIGDKDSILQLQGTWFYELSELDSVKKAETTKVKAFISSTTDKFRPPYGHHMQRRHRQTILVGSTNEEQFLADASGSRRFIPVEVRQVDAEWITTNRDQLWAEAVVRFDRGESYWYDMTDMTLLSQASERFQQSDAWDSLVLNYIVDNKKSAITMAEVLTVCLMLPLGQINRAQEMRVAKILKTLECSRKQRRVGGKMEWFYQIPPEVISPEPPGGGKSSYSAVPGLNAPPPA
jgi:predicted P-loop ATPase